MIKIIIHCRTLTWNLILIYLLFYVIVEKKIELSKSLSEKNVGIASKLSLYDDCSLFVYVSCCKKYYVIGRTVTHIIKKLWLLQSIFFQWYQIYNRIIHSPKPLQHLKVPFQWPAHIYITWLMLMGFSGPKCRFIIKQTQKWP